MWGATDQLSVGGVGPGVILALDGLGDVPGLVGTEAGARWRQTLKKRPESAAPVPEEDQTLARDHLDEEVARLAQAAARPTQIQLRAKIRSCSSAKIPGEV
jgi:hypothetical protein